jgi:hypothetical protein
MSELIPPAVIDVMGNDVQFLAVIARDKAALADLAKQVSTATIDATDTPLTDKIAAAKVALRDFAKETRNARIGANAAPFWADIAKLKTTLDAMSPLDLSVDANTARALAQIDALKGDLASSKTGALIPTGGGSGGGSKGFLARLLSGGEGGGLKDLLYGGDSNSFLKSLLSPLTAIKTLFSANFGSIGSLAGFGPEHLATTLGAAGGVGVSGAAGGGLLGLGSIGKMGVGSGSDAAVMHTTMSNVTALKGDYANLAAAVATYGANSRQAQVAQSQIAQDMAKIAPAARAAVAGVAQASIALGKSWQSAIGPAEVTATKIMQQVLKLASDYIPRVAGAAKANLAIINSGLKPLFSWLEGSQGVGVFNNLENLFKKELPTAVHAFDQGVELLLRTMSVAAGYTGGFVTKLDRFLTKTNSPTGFAKWSKEIGKLIGEFHIAGAFLGAFGKLIKDVFKNDAGTGTAIIEKMTDGLKSLDKWVKSMSGSKALKELFNVHKGETLTLMSTLSDLITSFGKAYLTMAPTLVTFVSDIMKLANAFFALTQKVPGLGQIVALGAGFAIMESRSKTFTSALKLLGKGFDTARSAAKLAGGVLLGFSGDASKAESGIATTGAKFGQFAKSAASAVSAGAKWAAQSAAQVAKVVASNVAGAASTAAAWIASAASTLAGWVKTAAQSIAKVAVIVARNVAGALASAAAWAAANAVMLLGIGAIVAAVVVAVIMIIKHWRGIVTGIKDVWNAIKTAWDASWGAIKKAAETAWNGIKKYFGIIAPAIATILLGPIAGLVVLIATHWRTIESGVKTAWNAVLSFLKTVGSKIVGVFKDAGSWLEAAGKAVMEGLVKGVESAAMKPVEAVKHVGSKILGGFKSVLHIFSPSQDFVNAGQFIVQGLSKGISDTGTAGTIDTTLMSLGTKMLKVFKDAVPDWHDAGVSLMQGLSKGISDTAAQVATAATKASTDAVTAAKSATKTNSPSLVFAELGSNWMLGLVQGVQGSQSKVSGATRAAALGATGSLPRSGAGGAGIGAFAAATFDIKATFEISAPGGDPAAIKHAVENGSAHEFAKHLLTAMRVGAGTVNG